MLMYVTLQQAKDHIRMDHDAEDNDITLKIQAASAAVKNYLKTASAYEPERDAEDNPVLDSNDIPVLLTDSNGDYTVRSEVQSAVLILLGIMFRYRDGQGDAGWEPGYLPVSVTALLYPLREPAYA